MCPDDVRVKGGRVLFRVDPSRTSQVGLGTTGGEACGGDCRARRSGCWGRRASFCGRSGASSSRYMTWVEPPGLGAVGLALSGRLQAGSWRREHFAAPRLQTERPRIAGDPDWRPGLLSGSGVCSALGPGVLDDWVKRFYVSVMHPDLLAVSAPTPVSASGCAQLADLLSHQRSRRSTTAGLHVPPAPPQPPQTMSELVCHS
jgi:hypothetical protein